MTALCPAGGPSGPKAGTSELIAFDGSSVALLVTALGFPELAPVIAVVASGIALRTPDFCSVDPPADPGITLDDIGAVLNFQEPLAFAAASQRILSWFLRQYWFTVCECTGNVATPPPPPANLPPGVTTNPGLPSAGAATPCWDVDLHQTLAGSPDLGVTPVNLDLNGALIPIGTGVGVSNPNALPGQLAYPVPAGVNRFTLTFTVHEAIGTGHNSEAVVIFVSATGSVTGGLNATIHSGDPLELTVTLAQVPANSSHWFAGLSNSDVSQHSYTIHHDFFCGPNGPADLVAPCCPPDPLVNQYLQLILNIVENLSNTVLPPPVTSWRDGPRHSALELAGSFPLADPTSIGVRFDVTQLPSPPRILQGDPTFYWDMGFVTPGAIGVPSRGWRLVFEHQTFQLPSFTDRVHYTLLSGTRVDATELLPVTA